MSDVAGITGQGEYSAVKEKRNVFALRNHFASVAFLAEGSTEYGEDRKPLRDGGCGKKVRKITVRRFHLGLKHCFDSLNLST